MSDPWRECRRCWASSDGFGSTLIWPCAGHRAELRNAFAFKLGLFYCFIGVVAAVILATGGLRWCS